jgi:transposase
VKRVTGRKTDVRDSAWLAQLLECGLLSGSLVPPGPIRELRDLTRYRKHQVRDRAREVNRLHRVLEDAGIECALGASRAKHTALQALYGRVRSHRGHKKAVAVVAHQILRISYHLMRNGTVYQELGADYFDRRHRERTVRRHLRSLERLGYQVLLVEPAA